MLAVPIVIQVYLNAGLAYVLNRACGSAHNVAAPSALIGASNFFELAVAAAISSVRLSLGRGAGDGRWRAGRGPGDAVRGADRDGTRDWYEHERTISSSFRQTKSLPRHPVEETVRKSTIARIGIVRPSRRPPRGLLRARHFLNAIKDYHHAFFGSFSRCPGGKPGPIAPLHEPFIG